MAYLYLDESGCLGFDFSKAKTSKFFVITILFADDRKGFEKIIKKVYSELARRVKLKSSALHCHKEKPITR